MLNCLQEEFNSGVRVQTFIHSYSQDRANQYSSTFDYILPFHFSIIFVFGHFNTIKNYYRGQICKKWHLLVLIWGKRLTKHWGRRGLVNQAFYGFVPETPVGLTEFKQVQKSFIKTLMNFKNVLTNNSPPPQKKKISVHIAFYW